MSRDREPIDVIDAPLTAFQLSLVRAETPKIRGARQADFHRFIADVLRGLREPADADVRRAIDEAALRYGRPRA